MEKTKKKSCSSLNPLPIVAWFPILLKCQLYRQIGYLPNPSWVARPSSPPTSLTLIANSCDVTRDSGERSLLTCLLFSRENGFDEAQRFSTSPDFDSVLGFSTIGESDASFRACNIFPLALFVLCALVTCPLPPFLSPLLPALITLFRRCHHSPFQMKSSLTHIASARGFSTVYANRLSGEDFS